jgi:hypothetical protein
MTLRKVDRERGFPDELDALFRWALDDRVGQVQPPAYVGSGSSTGSGVGRSAGAGEPC